MVFGLLDPAVEVAPGVFTDAGDRNVGEAGCAQRILHAADCVSEIETGRERIQQPGELGRGVLTRGEEGREREPATGLEDAVALPREPGEVLEVLRRFDG